MLFFKKIFVVLLLVTVINSSAIAQKNLFVRVYPTGASRVIKGFYAGHSDAEIVINIHEQLISVPYQKIQLLKTRKTVGNGILIGATIGALIGAITGLIAHKDAPPPPAGCWFCISFQTSASDDAAAGFILGSIAGATVGTVTGIAKKKETLHVFGEAANWKKIMPRLDAWPVYNSTSDIKNSPSK